MQQNKIHINNSLMETTQHCTDDFPFQYYYDEIDKYEQGHVPWHWHKEFEFVTVSSGVLSCFVGNVHYNIEEGDGIFINSGILHKFESGNSSVDTIAEDILFPPEFIYPENSKVYIKYIFPFLSTLGISHILLRKSVPWQNEIIVYICQIYILWKNEDDLFEIKIHELVNKIWQILWLHKDELKTITSDSSNFNVEVRVKYMITFIENNYSNQITLNDIALSANVSKTEALRCFNNYVNRSPIDYLINYRIHKACHLLINTNLNISDIALECGFSSASYFNRIFKKHLNISPRKYRFK